MTTLWLAMHDAVVTIRGAGEHRQTHERLRGEPVQCLALDPHRPGRLYCGTFGRGVRRSDDGGDSWKAVGEGIVHDRIMALTVDPLQRGPGGDGVVYAGTEPSAVFRSDDAAETWTALGGLADLPSSATWAFPPRPETHHVRRILADPVEPGRLFVCIEAGALVRSFDGGRTWHDRVPDGPRDTHTLAAPPSAPGRLYAAAGDGYFESADAGDTWTRPRAGLGHGYLWSVAAHPRVPDTILVSASQGAYRAHDPARAASWIYRRVGGRPWHALREGLPDPEGTTVAVLAADPARPGSFFAANNRGIYESTDEGGTWGRLEVPWPERFLRQRVKDLRVAPSA